MNKHTYNTQTFYNEDAITYYLLGAWITDGCISISKDRPNRKSITLTSKDKDWLEIVNLYISPNKPLLNHGLNCYRLMYNSTELADWFIKHGCGPRKSLTLQFPNVPKQYLPDFIRGCWDGDGSISHTKSANHGKSWQSQANLTSGSLSFCEELASILNSYDIKCRVRSHGSPGRKIEGRLIASNPCWRVVLSGGGSVYNLAKLLYKNETQISMPRKNKIAQNIILFREANFSS
jgi:hypothetical protein